MKLRKAITSIIPFKIKRLIIKEAMGNATLSYSQEGEDILLERYFGRKIKGFYIDIGAHHPERFSNTKHFYDLGWTGINIDALPGSMEIFNLLRPGDINLEFAVSDKEEELIFYSFNEPALNTFSLELVSEYLKLNQYKVVEEIKLKTRTLSSILESYLPKGQKIDYLSIDVEGLDLEVLKSNNWDLYRPDVVLIECLGTDIKGFFSSELDCFMEEKGYMFFAKTINTFFFKIKI